MHLWWIIITLAIALNNTVQAQVVEDNTLSTEVNSENNRAFTVNAREQKGDNLFHSFSEFSIPNNGSVLFNNALTIQNIITRVTGASVSNINGLIQSNGTANLFLLNPNGIIFGAGARLDIGGSFIGTTAESLVFPDATFSTKPNSKPLLSVNVPLGLQFGTEGIVAIAFPNFTATDGLFNLPADFLDINYLFKNNFCQVSRNSKFIVTGRGGIPLVPQQDLLSEHTWSDWRIVEEVDGVENEAAESAQGVEVKKIALIQGWVTNAEGKVVLTAKPLAVTPRKPELNTPGCN